MANIKIVDKLVGDDFIADYVIESGSNYRKWNSGILEQWGTASLPNQAAGSLISIPVNYPVEVAVTGTYLDTNIWLSVESAVPHERFVSYTNMRKVGFNIASYVTTAVSLRVSWESKSRWK